MFGMSGVFPGGRTDSKPYQVQFINVLKMKLWAPRFSPYVLMFYTWNCLWNYSVRLYSDIVQPAEKAVPQKNVHGGRL